MRTVKAIAVYAAAVVVLGALLTPWVFWVVNPRLTEAPFRRVFDRVLLGVALVGLWPMARSLGIRSWREIGYVRAPGWSRNVVTGLALGIVSFAVAGGLLVMLGLRSFASPVGGGGQLLGFLLAGVAVAIVEETFFRGGLQSVLSRQSNAVTAIVVTSVVYSAVHFLKPKGAGVSAADVNWLSGFDYLGQVLARSWRAPGLAVGFVTLGLAGCILGLAYARTRALYFSMGIHAGWVFTLKTYAWLTDATGKRTWWGGSALVDNVLVWPVLLLVLWLCWKKLKPLPA